MIRSQGSPERGPGPDEPRSPALTFRRGGLSFRWDRREIAATGVLLALTLAIGLLALGSGERPIAAADILRALLGQAPDRIRMPIVDWRLPRILLGALAGSALGLSGAIFQNLSRNPLGSPDIIGFNTGAATGALCAMLLFDAGYAHRAIGSLAGGGGTALAVYALAWHRGLQSSRLILVGIGVAAMLSSINAVLLYHAPLERAVQAAIWQVGSLGIVGWRQVGHMGAAMALLLAPIAALAPALRLLALGDDKAMSLGLPLQAAQAALLALGMGLAAAAIAVVGPVAFVALAAPQLALRCTGSGRLALLPSAAIGGLLLVASDWAAQHLFAPTRIPVGIVTICLGGAYLAWLLARERHRTTG